MLRNIVSSIFRRQTGPYVHLSRKQLEDRLATLETIQNKRKNNLKSPTKITATKVQPIFNGDQQQQQQQQRIALQIAYLGWNYYGFTSSNIQNEETMPTVQGQLMKALLQTKLIQDPFTCDFSLSGRTDTGVSGVGQIVALDVRGKKQLPYLRILNSALPPDIRVLAWSPVANTFNARFDCLSRTYHYYFPTKGLCIDSIKKATSYLVGEHDFRNFCKFNPSKNLVHYRRTILSANVSVLNPIGGEGEGEFARFELKGTAFLWHQVRCIVSILLLVGQRLESPSIVQWLLDVDQVPGKPEYPLASGLPLILFDCEYNDQEHFTWYREQTHRTKDHFQLLWSEQMTKALLYQSFLNTLSSSSSNEDISMPSKVKRVQLGASKEIWTTHYKPLKNRRRDDPYSIKQQKYNTLDIKEKEEIKDLI
ncbi:pseudouridine synthase [Phascolomyces articulosus]|uniref:tRNA pseudouridine synthase n=1 Tax=Phascolomyces articulosus TaxID=60185 RepID=A0AAD5K9K6_9FUNG|nr:pseudouridine synthase [Phascolomyces articulosus]